MRQSISRLKRRKGFTLVECIIAIAVFAALVLIVFMILTHARNSAVKASNAEEDLTGMISNIVGDDSYKKFYANASDSLTLHVNGSATDLFTVSYNVVSGYRDYLICPTCGYTANRTAFMYNAAGGMVTDTSTFSPNAGGRYICPECPSATADFTNTISFRCEDCLQIGQFGSGIEYDDVNNCYFCSNCNSTSVMAWDVGNGMYYAERIANKVDNVKANSDLNITGLYANAIKYGDVNTPSKLEEITDPVTGAVTGYKYDYTYYDGKKCDRYGGYSSDSTYGISSTLFTMLDNDGSPITGSVSGDTGSMSIVLSYKGNSNHSAPGRYTLTVNVSQWAENLNATSEGLGMRIELPPCYNFKMGKSGELAPKCTSDPGINISWDSKNDKDKLNERRTITVENVRSNSFTIEFTLENYKSGYAFEYDYNMSGTELKYRDLNNDGIDDDNSTRNNTQGLFAWFGISSVNGMGNRTPDANGYASDLNGSKSLPHVGLENEPTP